MRMPGCTNLQTAWERQTNLLTAWECQTKLLTVWQCQTYLLTAWQWETNLLTAWQCETNLLTAWEWAWIMWLSRSPPDRSSCVDMDLTCNRWGLIPVSFGNFESFRQTCNRHVILRTICMMQGEACIWIIWILHKHDFIFFTFYWNNIFISTQNLLDTEFHEVFSCCMLIADWSQ